MNCSQAQSELALLVGQDLNDESRLELERHLAVCPGCRQLRQRMEHVMSILQIANAGERWDDGDSIWPAIAERIRVRNQYRRQERFNGWVPAVAVAAACLTIVVFASRPHSSVRVAQPAVIPAVGVVAPVANGYSTSPMDSGPMDSGMFGLGQPLGWLDRMQTRPVVSSGVMLRRSAHPEGLLGPGGRRGETRHAASTGPFRSETAERSSAQDGNRLLDAIAGW